MESKVDVAWKEFRVAEIAEVWTYPNSHLETRISEEEK